MTDALLRCCSRLVVLLEASSTDDSLGAASKLRDFLDCFTAISEVEQDEIRSLLTTSEARMIASLSVTAAEQALSEGNPKWLVWSLVAHDVEQFRDDPRNNLRLLAVTHHAAELVGIDPTELFNRVASTMSPRAARYVKEFAQRPPALRTLTTMGIRAVAEGGRVRFLFD